jgi:hypothetical protein
MRFWTTSTIAVILTLSWSSFTSTAQSPDTADTHVAAAREAAGKEYVALLA